MKRNKLKKDTTLDDLAGMVAEGFNDVNKGMNQRFDKVDSRLKEMEEGQEQIKLRLDNVAYRFELLELQKRIEHLEQKAGIRYR